MYFVRTIEEIHLSFKNSEKQRTQALTVVNRELIVPAVLDITCPKSATETPEKCMKFVQSYQ